MHKASAETRRRVDRKEPAKGTRNRIRDESRAPRTLQRADADQTIRPTVDHVDSDRAAGHEYVDRKDVPFRIPPHQQQQQQQL